MASYQTTKSRSCAATLTAQLYKLRPVATRLSAGVCLMAAAHGPTDGLFVKRSARPARRAQPSHVYTPESLKAGTGLEFCHVARASRQRWTRGPDSA
jgi:hypothetical protein